MAPQATPSARMAPQYAPCAPEPFLRPPVEAGKPSRKRLPMPPPSELERALAWLGIAPWWVFSTIFHLLLLLLLTLMGMYFPRAIFEDDYIRVSYLKPEPKRVVPPETRVRRQHIRALEAEGPTAEYPIDAASYEPPVFVYEDVEVSDHVEIPGELDESEALSVPGEGGFTDVPLGDYGTSSTVGLGGGGTGAYGRPLQPSGRMRRAIKGGGGKATESAVDLGLEWLARNQEADGHWDTRKHGATGSKWCDTTTTGFAVLAFLGAGHTERVGMYKDNVRRAVRWLIAQQEANGSLRPSHYDRNLGYANAIAGMALAEAAAMGRTPETREAAQRALDYGVRHQRGDEFEKQGYRYLPQQAGDISNTGWYIMQLKSAKVGGLKVPDEAFKGVARFLDRIETQGFGQVAGDPTDNGRHRYGYTHANQVTHRRGAMGCLTRQFMGVAPDELRGGVAWFVRRGGPPAVGRVDLYYWYYGTLCTFQQGGGVWQQWNDGLQQALLPTQHKAGDLKGSWDPTGDFQEHWGRVGQTALSVMCLEVYYRYLPMYR